MALSFAGVPIPAIPTDPAGPSRRRACLSLGAALLGVSMPG
jgi:hypothetical protein